LFDLAAVNFRCAPAAATLAINMTTMEEKSQSPKKALQDSRLLPIF